MSRINWQPSYYKIDWTSSDYMNASDYQNISYNLEDIWNELKFSYYIPGNSNPKDMHAVNSVLNIPYVHFINNLEQNLQMILDTMNIEYVEQFFTKTWYARLDENYKENPTFADWNRWELILIAAMLSINYTYEYAYGTPSGTFYAGGFRTLKHFSRGR